MDEERKSTVPVDSLTVKDVEGVAKDVLKTSLTWTLAGFLTKAMRALLATLGSKMRES